MNLEHYGIFKGLTQQQLEKFRDVITHRDVHEGDIIIQEGDKGDSVILLLEGSVKISKPLTLSTNKGNYDDREKEMVVLSADIHPFFGDYALFTQNNKRSANIHCVSNGVIGILKAEDLFRICESDYKVGYIVIKNLAEKITTNVVKQGTDILKLTTAISLIIEK